MNIIKLVHSCLVVEQDGKRILVDPGSYSWQSDLVKPELLAGLDQVVVTHAHPDHLDERFAQAVKAASPNAIWYGPAQVTDQLSHWGINGLAASDDPKIRFIDSEHADLSPWFGEQPQHTSFVLFDDLLIGGDCHTLTSAHGARILAGAINGGPWGGVVGFAKMIQAMADRPQVVIPLHDWHFNDEARQGIYARLPDVLSSFDATFLPLENGVPAEI